MIRQLKLESQRVKEGKERIKYSDPVSPSKDPGLTNKSNCLNQVGGKLLRTSYMGRGYKNIKRYLILRWLIDTRRENPGSETRICMYCRSLNTYGD